MKNQRPLRLEQLRHLVDITKLSELILRAFPNVKLVYLFGSYALGQTSESSDLDVAFYCGKPADNLQRWQLAQELASKMDVDVDLVDLATCSTVMRKQVVENGIAILGDEFAIAEFETVTTAMYQHLNLSRIENIQSFIGKLKHGRSDPE